MTNFIACPCLNIRLHLPARSTGIKTAKDYLEKLPLVERVAGRKLTLGLGGVTAEHEALTMVKPSSNGWRIVRCLNCNHDIFTYEVRKRPSLDMTASSGGSSSMLSNSLARHTHLAISSTDGSVYILNDAPVVAEEDIDKIRKSSVFSPAFRIVLHGLEQEESNLSELDVTAAFNEHVEKALQTYERIEQAELERRVAAYRAEQQVQLNARMQAAQQDKQIMLRRLRWSGAFKKQALAEEEAHLSVSEQDGNALSSTTVDQVEEHDDTSKMIDIPTASSSDMEILVQPTSSSYLPISMVISHMQSGSHGLASVGSTRAERLASRSLGTSYVPPSTRSAAVASSTLLRSDQTIQEETSGSLPPDEVPTSTDGASETVAAPKASSELPATTDTAPDMTLDDDDDDDDAESEEDMFLLDEEAALELADETPDGQTTSTVETKNAYAERGATTQTTSRPGMHFGTSVMPDRYGTSMLNAMQTPFGSVAEPGTWRRRSRKKFLPDFDTPLYEHEDESRDGLAALRQQHHGSQSPADEYDARRFFATSLPINIQQKDPKKGSHLRRMPPVPEEHKPLPTFDEVMAKSLKAAGDTTTTIPPSLTAYSALQDRAQQEDDSENFLAGGHSFSYGTRTRRNRYSIDHAGVDLHAGKPTDEHGDDSVSSGGFVAPHLLAAQTYTDDHEAVFGEMPRSARLNNVAI